MRMTAAEMLRRIAATLKTAPMVTAFAIFTAGVILFDRCEVPALLLWIPFAGCCTAALLLHRTATGKAAVCAALFLFGGAVWTLRDSRNPIPQNSSVIMDVEIADVPSERTNGRISVPVRIIGYDDGTGHRTARIRAIMWSDSTLAASFGDIITAFAKLRPFRYPQSGVSKLMMRRGYAGTLFVTAADTLSVQRGAGRRTIHRTAVERFERLDLPEQTLAVARSMGAGDRSLMSPELRQAYARSGVSHILAISGLHIGIVFLLANLLFRPLTLLRHGQIIAATAVLAPVWLYAAAAGFPPSVTRAAVMFSMLQCAKACTASYFSPNIVAATAFVMAAANPDIIFDTAFQLSFAAVAAIVTVGRPLFRLRHINNPLLRFLWDTFIIGIVAFTATAPLICNTFGQISLAGLILNPLVIICAGIIVSFSALWIVFPAASVQPAVEVVLGLTAQLQNRAVEALASCPQLSFEVSLSDGATIFIYVVFAISILIVASLGSGRNKKLLL